MSTEKAWPRARLERIVIWLFGKPYTFEHERGARHTVRARNADAAWRKMRSFIQLQMFGGWALTYDPRKVDAELRKCRIVEPPFLLVCRVCSAEIVEQSHSSFWCSEACRDQDAEVIAR